MPAVLALKRLKLEHEPKASVGCIVSPRPNWDRKALLKTLKKDWKHGSALKKTCCFFQRTQILFLEHTWQLTTTCNSNSRKSDAFLRFLRAPGRNVVQTHTQKHCPQWHFSPRSKWLLKKICLTLTVLCCKSLSIVFPHTPNQQLTVSHDLIILRFIPWP